MLTVTRDQVDSLADELRSSFQKRLDAQLMADFSAPPHQLDQDEIRRRGVIGWAAAKPHSMTSERDHVRYLYLRVALGDDWDAAPELEWMRTMFRSKRTGREKLDMAEAVMESAKP